MTTKHNEVVQKFQNLPPFTVKAMDPSGQPQPWYTCNPVDVAAELVINDPVVELETVASQIAFWGRITALAQRVWEVEQRKFRTWKAEQYNAQLEGVAKKPSDKVIEAKYRTHKDYDAFCVAVESAGEVFNTVQGILDAFKAKRDMLRTSKAGAY